MPKGLVFLLISPSGAGKPYLIRRALDDFPGLCRFVTYTTREPRDGEITGEDYHFVSRAEFDTLKGKGLLGEWQEFYGHFYGSSKSQLENFINNRTDAIAAYDVIGSKFLHDLFPTNVITIFVMPPSVETLRVRLIKRYGENSTEGHLRLARFELEMQYASTFKYLVLNEDLEGAFTEVKSIIIAEKCARRSEDYALRYQVTT